MNVHGHPPAHANTLHHHAQQLLKAAKAATSAELRLSALLELHSLLVPAVVPGGARANTPDAVALFEANFHHTLEYCGDASPAVQKAVLDMIASGCTRFPQGKALLYSDRKLLAFR